MGWSWVPGAAKTGFHWASRGWGEGRERDRSESPAAVTWSSLRAISLVVLEKADMNEGCRVEQ